MKILDINPGKENLFYNEIGKRPIFVKFYMDGCPHCENMKPAWKELENSLINNYDGDFTIMSVNARTLNTLKSPITEKVQGFPTLFVINKNGSKGIDYNGTRTKDDMLSFLLHNKLGIYKKQSPFHTFNSQDIHPKQRVLRRSMRSTYKRSKPRKSKKNIYGRKTRGGRGRNRRKKKYSKHM